MDWKKPPTLCKRGPGEDMAKLETPAVRYTEILTMVADSVKMPNLSDKAILWAWGSDAEFAHEGLVNKSHPKYNRKNINPPTDDYLIKYNADHPTLEYKVIAQVAGSPDDAFGTAPTLADARALANAHNQGDTEALAEMQAGWGA